MNASTPAKRPIDRLPGELQQVARLVAAVVARIIREKEAKPEEKR